MSIYNGVYFSPSTRSFYLAGIKAAYVAAGTWPTDAIVVTDDVFKQYGLTVPKAGYMIGETNGAPSWVASK